MVLLHLLHCLQIKADIMELHIYPVLMPHLQDEINEEIRQPSAVIDTYMTLT